VRRKSTDKQEVEADAIGYMPERFTAGYFELVRLGLATDPHGQVFDNEASSPKRKYHQHAGGLRDEPALRFKAWVDRQLRAIGRDIQAYLNARDSTGPSPIGMSDSQRKQIAHELERKTELKCHGCGKYVSWQWSFCAWCGHVVLEGKESSGKKVSDQRRGDNLRSERSPSESTSSASIGEGSTDGSDTHREDGDGAGQGDPGTTGSSP
jgi:hypothetical protein